MRFAERHPLRCMAASAARRFVAAGGFLACVLLGACAQFSKPAPEDFDSSAAAAQTSQAKPQAPAGGAADASQKSAGKSLAPVNDEIDAGVLLQFDDALRALQDGHTEDAEHRFVALTRSHPELGGPHANLGIIYRHEDKIPQSIAELEKAVQCNPQQPVFWNQLGIAYRLQGQFPKARDAYEHAIHLDPSYPGPYLNLGVLFDLYLWDSKKAQEYYDLYLKLTPGGDEKVVKWVADLKNRNRQAQAPAQKEKE